NGKELFRKERFEPKSFRIMPSGVVQSLAVPPLYRLPSVLAAARAGATVYVVEGEKDADALTALGLTATCNFDGASTGAGQPKWRAEYAGYLRGAEVVVVADRDEAGLAHAHCVQQSLAEHGISSVIRAARVGKDVSDHLAAGWDVTELQPLPPTPGEEPIPST